jgi:hypothetical protein
MFQTKQTTETEDVRIKATTRIWTFAMIMLGLCVPFIYQAATMGYWLVAAAVVVPVCVVVAAGFATAAVWGAFGQRQIAPSTNDLKQLEERMANLEITCYGSALQSQKDLR